MRVMIIRCEGSEGQREKGHQHYSEKRAPTNKALNFELLRFAIREKRLYFFDIEVNEISLAESPWVRVPVF